MNPTVYDRFATLAGEGKIQADPAQDALAVKLDALAQQLQGYRPAEPPGPLGRLFGVRPAGAPRGLYIYGEVGRGKTFLMDLFFAAVDLPAKRRVHFHAFMADVHARVHRWRQARKRGEMDGDDPIAPLAAALAGEAALLCFDEFAVRDIADAMILGRLFEALFSHGVVVVATSNVAPADLYRDGLNRALFLPFIALLEQRMEVVGLVSRHDYRLEKLSQAGVWFCPDDAAARTAMDAAFARLTGAAAGAPAVIERLGRAIDVPQAVGSLARFDFNALCRRPLSAGDYVALANRFETIFLDDVPVLGDFERDAAKRFINFIDAAYDARVKLVVSAAAEPDALALSLSGGEAFEFQRTASRLVEMRSRDYLAQAHIHAGGESGGDLGGLVVS